MSITKVNNEKEIRKKIESILVLNWKEKTKPQYEEILLHQKKKNKTFTFTNNSNKDFPLTENEIELINSLIKQPFPIDRLKILSKYIQDIHPETKNKSILLQEEIKILNKIKKCYDAIVSIKNKKIPKKLGLKDIKVPMEVYLGRLKRKDSNTGTNDLNNYNILIKDWKKYKQVFIFLNEYFKANAHKPEIRDPNFFNIIKRLAKRSDGEEKPNRTLLSEESENKMLQDAKDVVYFIDSKESNPYIEQSNKVYKFLYYCIELFYIYLHHVISTLVLNVSNVHNFRIFYAIVPNGTLYVPNSISYVSDYPLKDIREIDPQDFKSEILNLMDFFIFLINEYENPESDYSPYFNNFSDEYETFILGGRFYYALETQWESSRKLGWIRSLSNNLSKATANNGTFFESNKEKFRLLLGDNLDGQPLKDILSQTRNDTKYSLLKEIIKIDEKKFIIALTEIYEGENYITRAFKLYNYVNYCIGEFKKKRISSFTFYKIKGNEQKEGTILTPLFAAYYEITKYKNKRKNKGKKKV